MSDVCGALKVGAEDSGEEGVGETMPQVYDTHYFSLAHLFGFKVSEGLDYNLCSKGSGVQS